MGRIIDRRRVMGVGGNPFIQFADPTMKSLCVGLWGGADGGTAALNTRVDNVKVAGVDGELTYEQAASIKAIANNQFRNNTTITSFDEFQYFTELTSIGTNSFLFCSGLTSINIPSGVTSIGYASFRGCGLTSINIPNSVTSIGAWAFGDCRRLIAINIPNGITRINTAMFRNCAGLTSINIPDRVTIIDTDAFKNTAIQEVLIYSGVTSINSHAFNNCTQLAKVTILAVTPPTLGDSAFADNKAGRKIYVPAESVEAYKTAAGWSTYADDIEAIPT